MRVKRFTWLAAFAVCVAIGGWLVVSNNTARSAAPPPPNPDIPITAGAAQAQDVPVYLQGIGTVQASTR